MKVAEIQVGPKVQIEKKYDDCFRVLYNEQQKEMYISEFGNVDVVYDAKHNVYRVSEFSETIASYNRYKTIDCNRWGCE